MKSLSIRFAVLICALLCIAAPVRALTSDQIVLIVNRAEPAGAELAHFYAQARGIPPDRILALDLPTTEELPFDRYEREVPPVVRKFLRERGLDQSVRCLVTFYGVPLRIMNRENGRVENFELSELRETMTRIVARIQPLVGELESQAALADPNFRATSADIALDALMRRAALAGQAIEQAMARAADVQAREQLAAFLRQMTAKIAVPLDAPGAPSSAPATAAPADLLERPFDPAARQTLREIARFGGIFNHARLIQYQMEYLLTDATSSAFDNELALIFWPPHTRVRWQENPLNAKYHGMSGPPTVMVMRLDAPTPQKVKDMIANTLATERDGLRGRFVLDARGLAPRDGNGKEDAFGVFDQKFRDLASLVEQKTKMPVKLDNRPEVFPANAGIDDVALYSGWYSLSNYMPAFKFNRGAVGYHVASFELLSLHGPPSGQWVRHLIDDGVVATLGPVAEPYLHSFPPPDEFFPLLMTGKLTLAEVYWATTPLTSWMQTCIGDPLYTPFAKSPAMAVDDLPPVLKRVLDGPATRVPAANAR